jgi:alkylation response protein AidB-like acyl-CoA dehydrogenase
MRASGSSSVTFSGVEVPTSALRGGFLAGDADAYMDRNLVAGLFHASASLGIAENAASASCAAVAARGEPDARTRTLVAENAIELGACRATLERAARDEEPLVYFAGGFGAFEPAGSVAPTPTDFRLLNPLGAFLADDVLATAEQLRAAPARERVARPPGA